MGLPPAGPLAHGDQRDAFEVSLLESRGKSREVNLRDMRAKLVAASVRKADDSRVFTDGQVVALGRKNAAALQRVFRVAQRLSGLAEDEVDELISELGEDPSVGSGSDWRWRWDIGRSPPASAR